MCDCVSLYDILSLLDLGLSRLSSSLLEGRWHQGMPMGWFGMDLGCAWDVLQQQHLLSQRIPIPAPFLAAW